LENILKFYKLKIISKILIYCVLLNAFIFTSCKTQKQVQNTNSFQWNPQGDDETKRFNYNDALMEGIKSEFVLENINDAIRKYQTCINLFPNDITALFKLGSAYYKVNRLEDAKHILEKAFSLNPQNLLVGNQLAMTYQRLEEFDLAAKVYQKLLISYPDNLEINLDLANVLFADRKFAQSIKILNMIEQKIGITEPISNQKKIIYLTMNKLDKAVAEVEKLMKSEPQNTDFIRLLIDLYVNNNQDEKVFELYKKITEIDPNDGSAQIILADYYNRWNMQDKAEEAASKALNNPDLDLQTKITFLMLNYLNKGIDTNNKDFVLKCIDVLIKVHKNDSRVYSFRADVLSALNKDEEALPDYIKALEGEKNTLLLWNKVIVGLMKKGKYNEAGNYCTQAIEHFPLSPELYLYNGMCNLQLKSFDSAVIYLETGINYVKNNDVLKYQFFANLGEAYNGTKNYQKSDYYFDKALHIDSLDMSLLNNYAFYLSVRKEKLELAERLSFKTISSQPENPAYLDTYGWILYLKGNYLKAKEYIGRALEKKSWDAEILEHYGDVLYKLGDIEGAVKHWERAKLKGSVSILLDKKISDRRLYE